MNDEGRPRDRVKKQNNNGKTSTPDEGL